MEIIFMVAWCMWYNRNAIKHGSALQSAKMVGQEARTMLADFQVANHVIAPLRIEMNDSWSLSMFPNYKVNMDVAFFSQTRGSRVGVLIRDH